MTGRVVWFVVPEGIDDPARVSGGNVFDSRIATGLRRRGWEVRLVQTIDEVPAGALLLVDGLVALQRPGDLEAGGRRVAVLVHMVAGAFDGADAATLERERRALACADLAVVTSGWARDELIRRGLVDSGRIVVARPGSDEAPLSPGTPTGGSLVCVGVVAPHKGQDLLIDALAELGPLGARWTCTIAGSVAAEPGFARRIAARAAAAGVADRITWAGVLGRRDLDALYARADLLVAPSRTESYGMAVADALRRGIPVLATRVGGIPEAVDPGRAAMLVTPDRPAALHEALRRWMTEPSLRAALHAAARREGPRRAGWDTTAAAVDRALRRLA